MKESVLHDRIVAAVKSTLQEKGASNFYEHQCSNTGCFEFSFVVNNKHYAILSSGVTFAASEGGFGYTVLDDDNEEIIEVLGYDNQDPNKTDLAPLTNLISGLGK